MFNVYCLFILIEAGGLFLLRVFSSSHGRYDNFLFLQISMIGQKIQLFYVFDCKSAVKFFRNFIIIDFYIFRTI